MTVVDVEEETAEVIGFDVKTVVIETDGVASVNPMMIKKMLKFIVNCLVLLPYTFTQRYTSIYILQTQRELVLSQEVCHLWPFF